MGICGCRYCPADLQRKESVYPPDKMDTYQYCLRRNIAKRRYELELDSLRLFELTTQSLNIKNSKETTDYCREVAQNNLDMVKVEIERHKIELKEMTSQLK
jgi:hypothetical protein